ncbi:MAG: hypothetical protein ACJ8F1_07740 [Polyangia bacterium]
MDLRLAVACLQVLSMVGCLPTFGPWTPIQPPQAQQRYEVFARANSSSGGAPLTTIFLTAGEQFAVEASNADLWSAGRLPRLSDANGLTGERYAAVSDDSGLAPGTHIGTNFGLWQQYGLTAPFGSLVGEIDGEYFVVGSSFRGKAPKSGTLKLLYWDSNNGDNSGSIRVSVHRDAVDSAMVRWLRSTL